MPEIMPEERARLLEMLETAQKIQEILARWSRAVYDETEVLCLALRYLALTFSEAALHVSDERKTLYREIPWPRIADMRQDLLHGYTTGDLKIPWVAEQENAGRLAAQLMRMLEIEFGIVVEPYSVDQYLDAIRAYCETKPIESLSEFAPGFESWIRPHTDIGLLVDYSANAPVSLLDLAGYEIDLSDIICKRVCLFTTKGLRQSPYQVPFEIGRRLYEKRT